ncbi:MAG TPA: hypothetical protein VGB47_09610 [Thermoanaerobaculia bacterium]
MALNVVEKRRKIDPGDAAHTGERYFTTILFEGSTRDRTRSRQRRWPAG